LLQFVHQESKLQAENAAILALQNHACFSVNSAKTGRDTVLKYTMGGAALAAIGLYAMESANSRSEQTRARAAQINTERPKSAGDSRVINGNTVAYTTANDSLAAARDKARDTLSRFVSLLNSGMKATFTVKFPLTQNGHTEHIWLQVAKAEGNAFSGLLANEPVNGTKYKLGQPMSVASADVEDWMVRTSDAIYGGYSARYQIKDLPKEQAERVAAMFRD
jgi:uncharacterized protein YegJ (DUF2314 family)